MSLLQLKNPAFSSQEGDCSEYECPICYEALLPPIFQCFNGHLLCKKCIESVRKCPVCRDALPKKRIKALAVEKIILKSMIPCQFSSAGCKELLINSEAAEMHQFDCSYATLKYCSLMGLKCNKPVRKAELLDHIFVDHKGMYAPDYKYRDKLEISDDLLLNFGENGGKEGERTIIALVHTTDQTFVLKCVESQNEKMVSWKVLVLGSEAKAREFSASIKIIPTSYYPLQQVNNSTVLKWRGSILPIKSSPVECLQSLQAAQQQHLLSVPYKYFPSLFSFRGENEELIWKIRLKIWRTSDSEPMVHFQVTCDSCNNGTYISGPRYKCMSCSNYDLCAKCMGEEIHAHHFFIVIPRPSMRSKLYAVLRTGDDSIATSLGVDPLETHLGFCDGDCQTDSAGPGPGPGVHVPIAGVRFKCIECPDYDLCENCMKKKIHSHHLFVLIRNQGMIDQLRNVLQ